MDLLNKIKPGFQVGSTKSDSQGTTERDLKKVYSLMGVTAFIALVSGYFLSSNSFFMGTIFLVLFIAFFLVQTIALRYSREALLASIVDTLGLTVFFYKENLIYLMATILIVWILFAVAHERGRLQVSNMVKIHFGRAVRPVVGIMLVGITIFISFILFVNGNLFLQEQNVGKAIDVLITPIAKSWIGGFSSDANVGELMESFTRAQIEQQEGANLLSKFQKDVIVTESIKETAQSLSKMFGYEIDTKQTLKNNVFEAISNYTKGLSATSAPLRIGLLILTLLLVVKSIEIILYLPLALIGFVLFQLMIAFNILTIQFESQSKEVINIV